MMNKHEEKPFTIGVDEQRSCLENNGYRVSWARDRWIYKYDLDPQQIARTTEEAMTEVLTRRGIL
jgi:hypothetical protein